MRIEAPIPKTYVKKKVLKKKSPPFLIVSSQANIRNTFFDQKSPRHLEVGVSDFAHKCKKLLGKTDPFFLRILSSQANIFNIFFNLRSPRPLEVGVSDFAHNSNFFQEKNGPFSLFGKLCHHRPKLGTGSLTRTFYDFRKWVFCDGPHKHTD